MCPPTHTYRFYIAKITTTPQNKDTMIDDMRYEKESSGDTWGYMGLPDCCAAGLRFFFFGGGFLQRVD
jgi:hypothetical protein